MTEKSNFTTIPVRLNTKETLEKMKQDKDWDTFLRELVNTQGNDEVVVIPDSVHLEDVLTSIEEVKPPSKYREMLFFFMVSIAGGVGLGLVIP
ncbi:MAG: hypothetical protein QW251_03680 [Desulfurococcaceae archaeon]